MCYDGLGSDPIYDLDNDGTLNAFERCEAELFEFGDGSMREPGGVASCSFTADVDDEDGGGDYVDMLLDDDCFEFD